MKLSTTSAVTAALVAILAGCGTGSPDPDLPPLGEVSTITSVRQVVRPIAAYLPTASQNQTVERAVYLTSARCLRRFGISKPPGPDPAQTEAARHDVRGQLFGYFGPDLVATTGYNALSAPGSQAPAPAATLQVFTGRNTTGAAITEYQGKAVPKGGCLQKGLDAVGGSMFLTADASGIPGGGPQEPLNDPRIVDADHRWSACMKSHGFAYATPADAYTDPRWRTRTTSTSAPVTHSPAEIATATADTACKQSTNFMGIAVAVETAYDKRYIAANAAQLASFTQRLHKRLADAEKIISDGGAA